jgi:hypothetical protein
VATTVASGWKNRSYWKILPINQKIKNEKRKAYYLMLIAVCVLTENWIHDKATIAHLKN